MDRIPEEIFQNIGKNCPTNVFPRLRRTCKAAAGNVHLIRYIYKCYSSYDCVEKLRYHEEAIRVYGKYVPISVFLPHSLRDSIDLFLKYHIPEERDWDIISAYPYLNDRTMINYKEHINWEIRAAKCGAVTNLVAKAVIHLWDTPTIARLNRYGKLLREYFDKIDWIAYFQIPVSGYYHEIADVRDLIDWKLYSQHAHPEIISAMYNKFGSLMDKSILTSRDYTYKDFDLVARCINLADWLENDAKLLGHPSGICMNDSVVSALYINMPYTHVEIMAKIKKKLAYTSSKPSDIVSQSQP
nr:hypothetical protein K-LCC10_0465 [Kaumoebavirus]